MILGTFWCQREKLWVRFNDENGAVTAEVARISDNPKITTPWEAVSEGAWFVSYTDKKDKISLYYAIKNNKLYHSEGTIDKYSNALMVSEKRNGKYFLTKNYSFPNELKEETELTPYHDLPLTPEMHAEKIRSEEAAQKLKQEQEEATWKEIRTEHIYQRGMNYIYNQSPFAEEINSLFLDLLKTELVELDPRNFDSPYDYLLILKDIIENNNNQWHQRIKALAAKTEFDELLDRNFSRNELFELKKSLLFNVIKFEAISLAQEFNIDFKIFDEQEIIPKKEVKNLVFDDYVPDYDYQGFNNEPDLIFDIESENQKNLQYVIQESLQVIDYPRENANQNLEFLENPRDIKEFDKLVVEAATIAQEKYANWYNAGTGYKRGNNLREGNGFFSWLRHGADGQQRASNLISDILESDLNNANSLINDFLKADSTRYYRHSFASFLLDDLKTISNSPWSNINYIEGSNLYDQKAVIEQLDSAEKISASQQNLEL